MCDCPFSREDFADVTIVCGDNQLIEAHKMILSTSSSFFGKILRQNKHPHPLLYLSGVKGNNLVSILDFIYNGEVNILNKDLEEFMKVGEELQIKGLKSNTETSNIYEKDDQKEITQFESNQQRTISQPKIEPTDDINISISDKYDANAFSKITTHIVQPVSSLDDEINALILKANKGFSCTMCGAEMNTKQHMRNHVESKHIDGVSHPCTICEDGKTYKTRHSLSMHQAKNHKIELSRDLGISFSEGPDTQDFVNAKENAETESNISASEEPKANDSFDMSNQTLSKLDEEIDTHIEKALAKGYSCKTCGVKMDTKQHMRNHVEGRHVEGISHTCNKCDDGKTFKSRQTLYWHKSTHHRG